MLRRYGGFTEAVVQRCSRRAAPTSTSNLNRVHVFFLSLLLHVFFLSLLLRVFFLVLLLTLTTSTSTTSTPYARNLKGQRPDPTRPGPNVAATLGPAWGRRLKHLGGFWALSARGGAV